MSHYYFDIETTGLNPWQDRIISLQAVRLEPKTGQAVSAMRMFSIWRDTRYGDTQDDKEKDIIKQALNFVDAYNPNPFAFIPIGYNLDFENRFIKTRLAVLGLPPLPCDIVSFERPKLDLRPIGVFICNGEFKGSSLEAISGKVGSGKKVLEWYETGDFQKIDEYAIGETESFIAFLQWLYATMPKIHKEFIAGVKKNGKDADAGTEI